MTVRFTSAPRAFDYTGIVLGSSDALTTYYGLHNDHERVYRRVEMVDDQRLVDDQCARYKSGMYSVGTEAEFREWTEKGWL